MNHILVSSLFQKGLAHVCDMGGASTFAMSNLRTGVSLGSVWGQSGVSLGSVWGQSGVSMGSVWGGGKRPAMTERNGDKMSSPSVLRISLKMCSVLECELRVVSLGLVWG